MQGTFMMNFKLSLSRLPLALLLGLSGFATAGAARAATLIATPGEQNTQSGENGCATEPCQGGHWLHYPELLQKALGADYTVMNNGDGGAVLGCDDATKAFAGGNSFCASGKFADSTKMPPGIVIIGPFGEHDQRLVASSTQNVTMYDTEAVFESAYEGMVQKYLQYTQKIIIMTPIDLAWNAPAMPQGKDLVKDSMLMAATAVAQKHNLKLVDTYTAMTSTPQLTAMYNGTDGQVNQAGQQKMADMLLEAIMNPGTGGTGGAGGMGGTGGAGGAAGMSGGGLGGFIGVDPIGGSGFGGVGTSGSNTGAGGAGAGAGGAATATGGAATAGQAPVTSAASNDSGGCTVSRADGSGAAAGALLLLGLGVALRNRRARKSR
jgi:hypothetical protein